MENSEQIFLSNDVIMRKHIRILLAIMVAVVVIECLFFVFVIPPEQRAMTMIVSIVVFCTLWGLIFAGVEHRRRAFRETRLHMNVTALWVEHSKGLVQKIPWDTVTKIRQHVIGSSEEIVSIEVYSSATRPFVIAGFERMAEIMTAIDALFAGKGRISTRRWRYDWNNPVLAYSITVTIGLAMLMFYHLGGRVLAEAILKNLYGLFMVCMGGYYLIYGPLSRQYPTWRKWELVMAIGIIFAGINILGIFIVKLVTGTA